MTLDQMMYILERKYKNIQIGKDVLVICSTKYESNSNLLKHVPDARIMNWVVEGIDEPSQSMLEELWTELQDQYHSDPSRIDSEIFKKLKTETVNSIVEQDL